MISLDSASYPSCIGHNSCVLTVKIINVSNSVSDKTWRLFIQYHCVRTSNQNHNPKEPQTVCPFNMESVACGSTLRKIEIQSVELIPYLSVCEEQILNNSCTELIYQNVNTSCNGKQKCEPLIWNKSVFTWDDCIRIPKLFNISFSCVKAIPTVLTLQGKSNVEGVAVGVTVGMIIIVGVVVGLMWFVRRKRTDDKHNIANHHDENNDYIGNQNIAMSANSTSEVSKNLELKSCNPKGTNKGETVNDLESNFETRIRRETKSPYYNLANHSTVLEPMRFPVQHLNANNYEMAKPITDSKNDKNRTISENDNYAFYEDQYDISGKIDRSDHQQGIYSRAVDTVYDIAIHSRQNIVIDQTYDHAFGPTTGDDYDIAKN